MPPSVPRRTKTCPSPTRGKGSPWDSGTPQASPCLKMAATFPVDVTPFHTIGKMSPGRPSHCQGSTGKKWNQDSNKVFLTPKPVLPLQPLAATR